MFRPLLRFSLSARARLVAALGLTWALSQAAPACVPDEHACERSRTCPPSTGGLTIIDEWKGGASGGPSNATGAAAGNAGEGGMGGWGGAGTGGTGITPGDECSPNGRFACSGHASQQQLVCVSGFYVAYGTCPEHQRCDTRPGLEGLCQPVVAACEGHLPGDVVCSGSQRMSCGVDLVTATILSTCSGGCVAGKCTDCSPDAPPTCEFNSRRSCTPEGYWNVTSCPADAPSCVSGECTVPPSCANLDDVCGLDEDEPCCTSPVVPGGTFNRDNDPAKPTTVSPFRLDRFEVTVARFRAFKEAWDEGWRPDGGAGKHLHVHDGQGLAHPGDAEKHESGWRDDFYTSVILTDMSLSGPNVSDYATWTPASGDNEQKPINLITGSEAFAFCIWDGGFLPSGAEWSFAATAGDAQRKYPWGSAEPTASFDLAVYGCLFPNASTCSGHQNIAQVGTAQGLSLFGQLDLAGNIAEIALGTGNSACGDCGSPELVSAASSAKRHGGSFSDAIELLDNGYPSASMSAKGVAVGVRCGRAP